jgi:hypothetical protein
LGVVLALVFFRSGSVEQALTMFRGLGDISALSSLALDGEFRITNIAYVLICMAIIWLLPNSLQWVGGFEAPCTETSVGARQGKWAWIAARLPTQWRWQPSPWYGAVVGILVCFALIRVFSVIPSQFLYFTF